jgi:hypothetical protein
MVRAPSLLMASPKMIPEIEIALDVQATRIMQQMRSGPKQLRALAEQLGAGRLRRFLI